MEKKLCNFKAVGGRVCGLDADHEGPHYDANVAEHWEESEPDDEAIGLEIHIGQPGEITKCEKCGEETMMWSLLENMPYGNCGQCKFQVFTDTKQVAYR